MPCSTTSERNPFLPASVKPNPLVKFDGPRRSEKDQLVGLLVEAEEKDPQLGQSKHVDLHTPNMDRLHIQAGSDIMAIFLSIVFCRRHCSVCSRNRLCRQAGSHLAEGDVERIPEAGLPGRVHQGGSLESIPDQFPRQQTDAGRWAVLPAQRHARVDE